jgi:hypothetical protein
MIPIGTTFLTDAINDLLGQIRQAGIDQAAEGQQILLPAKIAFNVKLVYSADLTSAVITARRTNTTPEHTVTTTATPSGTESSTTTSVSSGGDSSTKTNTYGEP